MIVIYFGAMVLIVAGLLANYFGDYVFSYLVNLLETSHPSYYAGAGPDFMAAFVNYIPMILIVGAVLLYVIVESQKPKWGAF